MEILQKTTALAALGINDIQHPEVTANDNTEDDNVTQQSNETHQQVTQQQQLQDIDNTMHERHSDGRQVPPGERLRLLASDGSEFEVPREVGSLLAELLAKVRSLEDLVLNQQRHATSSTHIAGHRPGHNVQFEDTYTVYGDDAWTISLTPPPARRDGQAGLQAVNAAWVGANRRSSARVPSWPNHSTPGATGSFSRSSMSHSRDIGQVVRKWQIRFSGAKSQSIDVFLARLEDC